MIGRREFITLLGGTAAAWPVVARAQGIERNRRIGVLMASAEADPESRLRVAAFERGLADLGWTTGRNLLIDYRWAAADPALMQTFAKELVGLQPDLILASTTPVVTAVAQETDTIPIVVGGYPAAWCDERRPASLVTRRGGVHRRVAPCGSKGSEPGHERGHNAQRPANAEATPSARRP